MSPKDAFGVVVRSVGLMLVTYGVWLLVITMAVTPTEDIFRREQSPTLLTALVLGAILLLTADVIAKVCYRNRIT